MSEVQAAKEQSEFLTFKNKPLVRCGNVIYYGEMSDPCVVMMQVVNQKKVGERDVPGKIILQLISTDATKSAKDRIIRRSEKDGLYNAIDLASIWLNRALTEKA